MVGLCFVAFMLCNMDRVNMSIAVLPMAKQYAWDSATIGLVQSSFFWCPPPPPPSLGGPACRRAWPGGLRTHESIHAMHYNLCFRICKLTRCVPWHRKRSLHRLHFDSMQCGHLSIKWPR